LRLHTDLSGISDLNLNRVSALQGIQIEGTAHIAEDKLGPDLQENMLCEKIFNNEAVTYIPLREAGN